VVIQIFALHEAIDNMGSQFHFFDSRIAEVQGVA